MKDAKVLNFRLWLLSFSCAVLPFGLFGCNVQLPMAGYPAAKSTGTLMTQADQIIRQGLSDENPRIRAGAIEVVAATRQTQLMPKVRRLLKDEFVPVRFAAALAVGDTEYRLAESEVAHLLNDADENIRIAAAYAMGKLGSSNDFELVGRALASSDQTARANAALLLGKSGDKSMLKLLYWVMRDGDSKAKVRLQAAEAIAMLGDERIYPNLWTMLLSVYADDRAMGVRAMGALGTKEAQNALITMLDDDVLEIRLAAAEQLGRLGDVSGEPEVLDVFTKKLTKGLDKESLERVNVLTALAIGRIGTASLTAFLPRLLTDESKSVRIAAARAVFMCAAKDLEP